jgi:GAF domain-containing protein
LEADKPFWKLVQNKQPLFISDVSGDIPPGLLQSLTRGKQSAALIPLKVPEGTMGLICLTFQHRHEFSLEEKNLLTTLSEMIGIALHRISVLKNLEWRIADRTRALSTLNAIAHVISQSLDLDHILDAALVMVLETFRMDTGVIYLNPDKPEPKRESKEGKLLKRTEPKASYTSQRLEKRGKHKASSRIGNFPW